MRRATRLDLLVIDDLSAISIHALHEESDLRGSLRVRNPIFQSTLSMRRATNGHYGHNYQYEFQSTLSMRRATPGQFVLGATVEFQSTLSMRRATCISLIPTGLSVFQSTLSMRRATLVSALLTLI